MVRLLGGLAITVMTLYCSPRGRTGRGRGCEGGGLYPEWAAYRISEGSSPNVQAEVGRQVALLPIEQARAELARHGLESDEKAIRRIAHELGAQMLATRTRDLLRFRRGELPAGGELAGKRVAVPSRFAVDYLFLRRMLAQENMRIEDVQIVEMAPPDMPAALYANAVDAYCTGEPFGAAAQAAGYARPLRMTRDEWPKYICCVLTVREELIKTQPAMVQDLVNQILGAGAWLDQKPQNRETAVQIASGPKFFNQDPKMIRFVMRNGMECVVTQHGIAQVPALKGIPDFNIERELAEKQQQVSK